MMETNLKRFARRILLLHLVLLVLLLAVVFVASLGVYRTAREQAFEQAKRQQSLLVGQTASGLKGYYDSIFSDLELFKPINPDDEDTEERIPEDEAGIMPGKNVRAFRIPPMLLQQLNGRVAHLFLVEKGTYNIRTDGKQATIPTVRDIVDRNRHVDEIANAIRMRKPARLPHGLFGVMRQYLDAPFRHRHRRHARDRKSGNARAALRLNRALHAHQVAHRKSGGGQALARRGRIDHRKGGEMQSGAAGERRVEFAGQRRVGVIEQHFHIAAGKHCGDVA